jgi:hypothetical protein
MAMPLYHTTHRSNRPNIRPICGFVQVNIPLKTTRHRHLCGTAEIPSKNGIMDGCGGEFLQDSTFPRLLCLRPASTERLVHPPIVAESPKAV